LFGTIPLTRDGLSKHVNFHTFPLALMNLWRVATGDAWEEIMYACRVEERVAPVYFFAFLVLGSMVMVNLFVAVILVRRHGDVSLLSVVLDVTCATRCTRHVSVRCGTWIESQTRRHVCGGYTCGRVCLVPCTGELRREPRA
jgi:hypothetical protein